MIGKQTVRDIEVIPPYPGTDYSGKPYKRLQYRWWSLNGGECYGDMDMHSLLSTCLELEVKAGDKLRITVEVVPAEEGKS